MDVWTFLQRHFGDGFLGAYRDGELRGYVLFVPSLRAVQWKAISSGAVLRWALHALSGRYDLRFRSLLRILRNKAMFVRSGQRFRTKGDAQLLNVAVSPVSQGEGIATALVRSGLEAMAKQGVPEVRLEVRPWNTPAVRVYQQTGWREVGRTRDLEGEWLVMTAEPSVTPRNAAGPP